MERKYFFKGGWRSVSEIAKYCEVDEFTLKIALRSCGSRDSVEEFIMKNLQNQKIVVPKKKIIKQTKSKNYCDLGNYYGEELRKKVNTRLLQYKTIDLKKNLKFDLDFEWFKENILWHPCVYCGDWDFVGCDRIDNNKGHTKDNCVPCCHLCNITRGNRFTHEEMIIIGESIKLVKEIRNVEKSKEE